MRSERVNQKTPAPKTADAARPAAGLYGEVVILPIARSAPSPVRQLEPVH